MEDRQFDMIRKLKEGQHLVLTGGSPLKQQKKLVLFFNSFKARYGFVPFLEIENECTLMPDPELVSMIRLWNNSPKLSHSGNPRPLRYKPEIFHFLSNLDNAWFKFVISEESDWYEIEKDFLAEGLFRKSQLVLMPLAGSRAELHKNRGMVLEIAIKTTSGIAAGSMLSNGILLLAPEHRKPPDNIWSKSSTALFVNHFPRYRNLFHLNLH